MAFTDMMSLLQLDEEKFEIHMTLQKHAIIAWFNIFLLVQALSESFEND